MRFTVSTIARLICCGLLVLTLAAAGAGAAETTSVAGKPPNIKPEQVSFPGRHGLTLEGFLYRPAGAGPFPAVVALHGCSGLTNKEGQPSERHADWGKRLAAQSFVVLFPDSYGSRGLDAQCKVSDRDVSPSKDRPEDADSALAYLDTRSDVKTDAVSLLGWSNGGSTVLYSVEPRHAPKDVTTDFQKAIAFYPGCRVPFETGKWTSRIPLLILIGAADDWTAAKPCEDMVAAAKAAGETVDIVTYPGAYHDFDHPDLPLHTQDGLAFTSSGTGTAHTGTNPAARADALVRVPAFLAR